MATPSRIPPVAASNRRWPASKTTVISPLARGPRFTTGFPGIPHRKAAHSLCYTWASRHFNGVENREVLDLNKRSLLSLAVASVFSCVVLVFLAGCGKNFYFAGRNLPPSGIANRVLISIQNPSAFSKGALQIVDAFYDIRHSFNNKIPAFSISGYSGSEPSTIQNMPEEQLGAVYNSGDGSFTFVNYASEKVATTISTLPAASSSVFTTRDQKYLFAASQSLHVLTVLDRSNSPGNYYLNLPGVYRVSINPGGTVALAFVQNTNDVYSVVHLNSDQQQAAINNQHYLGAQDCEPQNLPVYCVFQVSSGSTSFDRPIKAVFSSDGTKAWIIDCGPECGGSAAGITTIPITGTSLNPGSIGPAGIGLVASSTVPIPGGATNAVGNGNTLYIAGQRMQSDGLFAGFLSVLDTSANTISGPYSISDGTHTKMILGDDHSLWISSVLCQGGERYKQAQAGNNVSFGCISLFNTSTAAVIVESYKGDGTGIAAVNSLHKVYTAEGGQVYIYNTPDGSERDNSNVTVIGTAYDVAYMDSESDGNNTTY